MACIGRSSPTLHPCRAAIFQDVAWQWLCQDIGAVNGSADTPHLLFVDDEPALRRLMAERLTDRGFDVVEAENGERALELLQQFAFDIIITDLRMPG